MNEHESKTMGNDRLEQLFTMQAALNADIVSRRGIEFSQEEWLQKNVLALISELSEVLDEVNFKWWKNKKTMDYPALHEELVDVLHFFLSMCLHAGLDAQTLFDIYLLKNKENFDRQAGLSSKTGYEAV